MNKTFYIVLFIFVSAFSKAQTNLIYNGDFELYDTCPVQISQPGDYQIETCSGWYVPTIATSDYFNVCAPAASVGVPANGFGYQVPYSGNAYCGVLLEHTEPPFALSSEWWVEYIQSKLVFPLKAGYEYEFSCQVVLSTNDWDYAFSRFGAYFSSTAISRPDGEPFSALVPQIMNAANNFITDTLNWTEITGKFIAHGGEEYITLGFFTDTLNPDTLKLINGLGINYNYYGSYYFIDAASLSETGKVLEYPNFFSPNGDNQNDDWKPLIEEGEIIEIYNRWGTKIFELSAIDQSWDGRTSAGEECTDGVYYFIARIKEEEERIKKGFIQLVR